MTTEKEIEAYGLLKELVRVMKNEVPQYSRDAAIVRAEQYLAFNLIDEESSWDPGCPC